MEEAQNRLASDILRDFSDSIGLFYTGARILEQICARAGII